MINLLEEPEWLFGLDGKNIPGWFAGYDWIAQILIAIITFIISIYAFKIYKLSRKKESYYLGLGFLFISISYFTWSILNLDVISNIGNFLCTTTNLCIINLLVHISIYIYMLLKITGLLTLTYMTLKVKSTRTYTLLLIMLILILLFSNRVLFFFFLLSSLLLFYLVLHYGINYWKNKQIKHLLMGIAFGLLFLGNFGLVLAISNAFYYVLGNIFILIAYFLILVNVMAVLRK